ncbi:unnamed protein product [Rhizoctonia solani]|uniref:Nucleolus and neural progenitor protein-like N-terminal domain-containing protein n=1 Tax=Rhizoctonia solani TaxID=456999 RepID=A0A8H2X2W1_9AGAM|nr:unnamed protein product [Rhizoctonia solani]
MPQRRFRLVASVDYRPRDNLDIPVITQLLKQLKSGNKNARSGQKLLFAEMHVLEAHIMFPFLVVPNRNKTSSLVSVRRMSKRIYETNLPGLLETLGGMFHEEPFEGQKVFSGAWTRVPPSANVAQILERLLDIEVLLKSAVVSFQKAYSHALMTQGQTTLSIIPSIYAVFETQEPPKSLLNKISKRLKNALQTPSPEKLITPPIKPSSHIPTPMNLDDMDEDLGFSIARTSLPPTTVPAFPPSPPAQVIIAPDSPTSPISPAPTTCLDIETTTPSSPLPAPPSQPPRAQIIPKNVPVEPAVYAVPVATSTKPKKKRKKTRDEIDDIFG